MEVLNIQKDYHHFMEALAANPDDPTLLKEFEQLKEFFRKSAMLTEIGDLHSRNLVLTDKGWLAMDFWDGLNSYRGHSIMNYKAFENLAQMSDFLPLFYYADLRAGYERLPARLRLELNDVVEKERDKRIGLGLWHRFSSSCYLILRQIVPSFP